VQLGLEVVAPLGRAPSRAAAPTARAALGTEEVAEQVAEVADVAGLEVEPARRAGPETSPPRAGPETFVRPASALVWRLLGGRSAQRPARGEGTLQSAKLSV
ncbi:MAG: hypothetical protein KJ056_00005, partial [Acidimicrobiia bacterium]|nr:hypothetical protein [Acidimicrobiia bacterium]